MSASAPRSNIHWSRKPRVPSVHSDEDSDSSEDITEDEEGADLTPALDAAILRTLGKIRRGEGVYEGENVLETELQQATAEAARRGVVVRHAKVEAKPYLLQDHHRATLLAGGIDEEAEEEENRWRPIPYAQEQRRLRKEAIEAFAVPEAEEDEGFEPVKKEATEGEKEDEEYRQFLLEMGGGEEEVRKLLGMGDSAVSFVRADADEDEGDGEGGQVEGEKKKKGKESEKKMKKRMEKKAKDDDDFLMNFILNRGWVDKADGGDHNYADMALDPPGAPPAKEEDADSEAEEGQAGPSHPWGLLDEDEFDEKADEFEVGYNFRFEEPGAAEISTHPRQIDSLVRRPDDARKLKRQARAERKAAAEAAREEEARKAKGKKRREMDNQLAKLRKEVGEKEWSKIEGLLEGEYDESTWERVVGGLFGGEGGDDDDEKPTWDDDDDGMDYPEDEEAGEGGEEEYQGENEEVDDGPINMDADFIGFDAPEKKKSKKDKKGKGKKGVKEEEEDDDGLTVEQRAEKLKKAMEEYKALDHEDMIGDLPARFHYTPSAPLGYGLTPAEILLATDAELNQIMSVKHLAPYRHAGLGSAAKGMGKRVKDLKDQLRERRWGEEYVPPKEEGQGGRERDKGWPKAGGAGEGVIKKKRMGKNERKRKMAELGVPEGGQGGEGGGEGKVVSQPKQEKQDGSGGNGGEGGAGGEAPKKRRKKNKHGAAPLTA